MGYAFNMKPRKICYNWSWKGKRDLKWKTVIEFLDPATETAIKHVCVYYYHKKTFTSVPAAYG